ncbi:uncharacterized protein LY89DRAFT_631235 [Mollisia scopiformis]|uniref:PrsW family intramembrane metalloprotease n=1 Tax=Mollisia scopiformis TaxID=149040 RepID=A0A132B6K7_MOLSC|nr:uncharacterized protein LY89DRAFT_631235 [Mollisia scopiformis]KUJ07639.1 hypothetical protein LY89DRAFT_631235 [Mollisia scopiformis]
MSKPQPPPPPLPQKTTLSLSTRLLTYLGPPSLLLLTFSISPQTALLSPLTLIPSTIFYRQWKHSPPSQRADLEPLIWTFVSAGTLGLAIVAAAQMAIVSIASPLIFRSNPGLKDEFWVEFQRHSIEGLNAEVLGRRARIAASWQNWVFNGVLFFVGAGLVEEVLKYIPVVYARRCQEKKARAYVDYAIAGALGFGFVEALGFMYGSRNEAWSRFLLIVFERMVLGQTGHVGSAVLTALRAVRRDFRGEKIGIWGVIWPAVMFHGLWDFVAVSASALEGNVGWIHPKGTGLTVGLIGMAIGMVGTILWQIKKEWKVLERELKLVR